MDMAYSHFFFFLVEKIKVVIIYFELIDDSKKCISSATFYIAYHFQNQKASLRVYVSIFRQNHYYYRKCSQKRSPHLPYQIG